MNDYSFFTSALEDVVESKQTAYTEETICDEMHEFSEEYRSRKRKLLRQREKAYFNIVCTAGRRAACIIAAIVVLSASTLSVKAVREAVYDFLIKHFSGHDVITFDTAENAPEMIEKEYFISDLPDGFKMTEYKRNILFVSQTFTKEDKYICFSQNISNAYVCNIDNEYGSSERYTDENGQTYLIYDFNDECMIMWKVEGYVLSISGNIDKDSLLDLCKSTKCK